MSAKKENQKKRPIPDTMNRLQEIVGWFELRDQVDVEEGLEKIKEAAGLIADVKNRLKTVENDFQQVKKELAADG